MELLHKPTDVLGLTVRFRRVGARAETRFHVAQAAEPDPVEKAMLVIAYLADAITSIEGVTEDGAPVPYPVDAVGRAVFIEQLGSEYVGALITALGSLNTPTVETLGK